MSRNPIAPDSRAGSRLTAILSKQPLPGQVKTRLVPPLSEQQAADLARAMLLDVLQLCAAAQRDSCFQTGLWYAPDGARAWFEREAGGIPLAPQRGAGLGERMAHAMQEGLARPGVASMVLVGSDQPMLGRARMLEAHLALEQGADLVLGPDAGGGYYLIGLRQPQSKLFTSISMSTAHMARETRELAERLGMRVHLLAEGYDVDLHSDILRLAADLGAWDDPTDPDFPRHSQALLQSLPQHLLRKITHG